MLETLSPATVRDPILLAYEERLRRTKRDRGTITAFRQTARKFQELLDDSGLAADQVEALDIEEWLAGLELKPSTKAGHLKRVRAAYAYARARRIPVGDPTVGVRLERAPDEEPRIIPTEELRAIKGRAGTHHEWAAFHLLAYAGLRRAEVKHASWEDVDWSSQTMRVLGKAGKLRLVPIHPALAEALKDVPEEHERILKPRRGYAIGDDTWDGIVAELTGGHFTAHDFRRTVASSLALNDVADPIIDKIMGWSPRAVGRRYYINVAGPQLQRAILRLYADDPV